MAFDAHPPEKLEKIDSVVQWHRASDVTLSHVVFAISAFN